jgi:hypothetical protein
VFTLERAAGPSEISAPGFPLRTGFLGSLIYWGAVYLLGVLKPSEGAALVTTIFIAHAIASDLSGRPLDFTWPLARCVVSCQSITGVSESACTACPNDDSGH